MNGLSLMMRLVSNLPITRATTRMRRLQPERVSFTNDIMQFAETSFVLL